MQIGDESTNRLGIDRLALLAGRVGGLFENHFQLLPQRLGHYAGKQTDAEREGADDLIQKRQRIIDADGAAGDRRHRPVARGGGLFLEFEWNPILQGHAAGITVAFHRPERALE